MPEHILDASLPSHPHTGQHAVGYRRDGRPIWPIRGGSGESTPATTDQSTTSEQNSPAPAGASPEPTVPNATAEQQLTAAEQRASEQSERAEQLQQALDAVQKALNPDGGESGQDPAQLAAAVAERDTQLGNLTEQLRTAQVELAAHKAAADNGARADRLLNSRSFLDSVAGLDPNGPKFEQQLGAAITAAAEADPDLYRAGPSGPAKGGAEFNGPPAGEQRPKSLQDAIAARLGG
ncbi:hypothetical protein K378_04053 [Streptomyces sp. Amel2xB2]|uniref:hypothetical protein n=1 Tax=Streptomyces sp. Amel2xB2 TaxID=1305829 RepID=UPI000DC02AD5|nr:hypothetical protein [Streptomyces sp. Amel2xB2]RAJ61693.1 hypothetical protein K378_04053 [Streptomyces sp. Amel2xB2]